MGPLSLTPELAIKVVLGIAAATGAWYGVDARVQRVEDKQITMEERAKEMRMDIKEIRRDVKDILAESRKPK